MRNVRRKLLERIAQVQKRFDLRFRRLVKGYFAMGGAIEPASVLQDLITRSYPKGQWHRWYKVNRQRQRRLSALKQMGCKIHPHTRSALKRWAVK